VPPPATAPQVETATEVRPVAAEIPGWAREPFQVLCFTADGVELGLPLIAMRGIVRLEGTLTRLPGLPPWHLGLLLARGEKVAIADLGWLLREGAPARRKGGSAYVLLLDGASWGLACESLGEARRVDAGAVRWRRGGSRAPLVRGVIRDDLRPVLAAEEILARLNGG
jgi:chemotaxis signal transduction protein